MLKHHQTLFARNTITGHDITIAQPDRRFHFYAIGRTGTGKSTMIARMIIQDFEAGRGVALIDPHGDLAEQVLPFIPRKRQQDLVYIDPSDIDFPIGLNVLGRVNKHERHLVASNLMSVFRKTWADSWGPRMAYLLHNALLALLEVPGSTLLGLVKLLADESFRTTVLKQVRDPVVRHYWDKEFAAFPDRLRAEVISPVQNKIGAYLTNRPLRNMLGQTASSVRFDRLLNQGGILIANLSKGRVGDDAANLLGSLLVSQIQLIAMSRATLPEDERRDFILYVDEFHNFTTESFADILAEARKYRLNLVLANQYLGQLDVRVRDAVLANVGTLAIFRIGPEDAEILGKEFGSEWPRSNLVNLDPHEIYYKLMRKGRVLDPRKAFTLPPPDVPHNNAADYSQRLKELSRRRYARRREEVERKINHFFDMPN